VNRNELRARVREDLGGVIDGELWFDPIRRAPYASDASIFEIDPLGVVVPRHWEDVRQTLLYAREQGIAVQPRGSGTGLAGESLGDGLTLDLSHSFRRILAIEDDTVTVEPGVTLGTLNRVLAERGRRLGPDPSGAATCTLGAMIAGDAAGARSPRYGTTADHVVSLSVMFAHGEEATLERRPWPRGDDDPGDDFVAGLTRKLAGLLGRNVETIRARRPRSPRNRCGYAVWSAGSPDLGWIDPARLVVGSEGTLAIVTQITMRTVPIPPARGVAVLTFAHLSDACAAVPDLLEDDPVACDLHDWRGLSLLRDGEERIWARRWFGDDARAALVLLFEESDPDEINRRLQRVLQRHRVRTVSPPQSVPARTLRETTVAATIDPREVERLFYLRQRILPLLMRRRSRRQAVPLLEDLAVDPRDLPSVLRQLQNVFKRHAVNWTLYGHAGAGQLHARPFLDLADPADRSKIAPLAAEIYERVWEFGGTISGEHGCGLARSVFTAKQYGPDITRLFREIKTAFDPENLLNPGKVVADDPVLPIHLLRRTPAWSGVEAEAPLSSEEDASLEWPIAPSRDHEDSGALSPLGDSSATRNPPLSLPPERGGSGSKVASWLTQRVQPPPPPILEPTLAWEERGFLESLTACNGCGACRSREPGPGLRMCPTFRALGDEAAAPRTQVQLLRSIAAGVIDPRIWGSDDLKTNAHLCVHCGLCRVECPAGVDVSALMIEAKAAHVANHGLAASDWVLSRLEVWVRLAGRVPGLANRLLGSRSLRFLLERLAGLSRRRCLPRLARRPFLKRAVELGWTIPRPHLPGPRAAYFVDVFANAYDPELAEASVLLLQKFGVNVYVPLPQRGSGMAALSVGDLDFARELALVNLRSLGNAVRDGYTIVCTEPTAALVLKREYPRLVDDLDALTVARHTMDLFEYLDALDQHRAPPEPTVPIPGRLGYHQPCHLRAQEIGTPGLDRLRRIPELQVEFIDRGCSGMAGTFGLSKRHFLTSLRAGRDLLNRLRDPDLDFGSTECGACRMQMEQGMSKRTHHPVKLLAVAHGLLPEFRAKIRLPKDRHEIAS